MEHNMKKVPVIPADHWFFRNSLLVLKDPLAFFRKTFEEHGDIYDVNSNLYTIYVLANPAHINEVLVTQHKKFRKSDDYQVLKHSLGNGLLVSEGEFWKKQRRTIQPAFHKASLQRLFDYMIADAEKAADSWAGRKEVEVHQEMTFLTLEIITNALFGSSKNLDFKKMKETISIGNEFLANKIMQPFSLPIWLPTKASRVYKKARDFNNKVIDKIIADRSKQALKYNDLLAMLMLSKDEETGEGMSHKQLRDEVMTMFIAGHDTTTNAMSWAFYLLAQHPKKQAILKEELARVLQGKSPTYQQLNELEYTQQVLEEAMRLFPPAWSIGRTAKEEVTLSDGYTIGKDTIVFLDIFMLHRHPAYWENPKDFIPERFTAENKAKRPKTAYIPFGAGQRMCVGLNFAMMEMKIILAIFLQRYTLHILADSSEVVPEVLITLRPKNGVLLGVVVD